MKNSLYYYSVARDIFVSACVEIAKGNYPSKKELDNSDFDNLGEYLIFIASNMAFTSYNEEGNSWTVEEFTEILKYLAVFFSGKDYLLDPDDEDDDNSFSGHNDMFDSLIDSYQYMKNNDIFHHIDKSKADVDIVHSKSDEERLKEIADQIFSLYEEFNSIVNLQKSANKNEKNIN